MTFGERLKLAIAEHDMNQREFGEKIGIRANTAKNVSGVVWRYCNNRRIPSWEVLQRILYALPMTNARWLISGASDAIDRICICKSEEKTEEFQQERKEENEVR